jgi:hypothetical protein
VIELNDERFLRRDPEKARQALQRLGQGLPREFSEFFLRYEGPFGGNAGYQLQDLFEEGNSIVESTEVAHSELGVPSNFVVLTELYGGGVLVLNTNDGAVYDIDFELGLGLLKAGEIRPRWKSFGSFLSDLFGVKGAIAGSPEGGPFQER